MPAEECECDDCDEMLEGCYQDCDPGEECQGCRIARESGADAEFEATKAEGRL